MDSTMLTALSVITMEQAAPTTTMMKDTKQFLDYTSTNNKAMITYNVSNMVLAVHSNASYLNKPQARNRAGGHFFLSFKQHYLLG